MPHRKIPLRDERILLGRTALEWFRIGYSWGTDTDRFGSHADEMLVYVGLVVGTCEGRPLTVAKAAQYTGLPRNTCLRRIEELCAAGVVKKNSRGYVVVMEHFLKDEETAKVLRICNMIIDACSKLSRMEHQAIV
jgi:hypothetical protein